MIVGCGSANEPFTDDRSNPLPLSELCADVSAYDDGRFWLVGRLDSRYPVCTAAFCGIGACCNYCYAPYTLGCDPPILVSMATGVPGRVATAEGHPGGNAYPGQTSNGCVGDDCGVHACSHLDPGGEVLLHGHLVPQPVRAPWDAGRIDPDRVFIVDVAETLMPAPADYAWTR